MQQIWITTAHITLPEQPMRLGAIMCYANDHDDYEARLQAYADSVQMHYRHQLAPLPLTTYLTRHGRVELLNIAKTINLDEVKVIYFDEPPKATPIAKQDYLLRHVINDVVPFDRQFGRAPRLFAPDEIFKLLFPHRDIPANMFEKGYRDKPQPVFPQPESDTAVEEHDKHLFGEPLPPLNCYMIVDATRHWLFPPSRMDCRFECLFQGKLAEEDAAKSAPHLVEIIPDEHSDMMGLFSEKDALTTYSWEDKLGIFVQSRHDFDAVLLHFRRLVTQADENGKWHFFRFYDPVVLRQYMEVIAKSPEKLARFFGYDQRIVHAFASGYDDSFHYYSLKALPEATQSAPIMLTDWEIDGFAKQRWLESRENIADYALQTYPHIVETSDREQFLSDLDSGIKNGYSTETAAMRYALCKTKANKNKLDFSTVEAKINTLDCSADERAGKLWNELMQGEEYAE